VQDHTFAATHHAAHPMNGADAARILFVIGQLERGGTENHLATIAPPLAARGWRPTVCSLFAGGPLERTLQEKGVQVFSLPPSRTGNGTRNVVARAVRAGRAASLLLRTIKQQRPTIVHFFLPASYIVGAPVAAIARVPIRLMSRRSLNRYQSTRPMSTMAERVMHRGMSAILGNSRAVLDDLMREGVPRERLGLIYNGLDTTRFAGSHSGTRAQLGLAPDAVVLGVVANLIRYKGHQDLLEALARASEGLPNNWRLLIIGRDDGIGDDLRRSAATLGIGKHVVFLGARNDVPELLRASDIGLLCSHQEGFANAILEGMAASLPMIVTDAGGNKEAVLDGATGLVVPVRDPVRLSEAILRLAGDAELRTRLGKAGRRRVEEHFTLEACVARYEALYRALLAGRAPQDVPGVGLTCAASPD